MAERICLLTFSPTKCKDDCFNCDCGGQGATKDMYVSINNVQRVCSITGGAADTDEGEYIAEVIRNNLENMVIEAQPVNRGRWIDYTFYDPYEKSWKQNFEYKCSCCGHMIYNKPNDDNQYCGHCGTRMDGEKNETD